MVIKKELEMTWNMEEASEEKLKLFLVGILRSFTNGVLLKSNLCRAGA